MRNFRLDDESGHQEALFSWAAYRTEIMPELQYMYHVGCLYEHWRSWGV